MIEIMLVLRRRFHTLQGRDQVETQSNSSEVSSTLHHESRMQQVFLHRLSQFSVKHADEHAWQVRKEAGRVDCSGAFSSFIHCTCLWLGPNLTS